MEQILSQLNQKCSTQEEERRQALLDLRAELDRKKNHLAQLIQKDIAKSENEALLEVEKSISAIDYVCRVDWRRSFEQFLQLPPGYQVGVYPLGTILAIMPWNFPMWQLFRVLPWNLLVGNSVLHKNSKYTPSITTELTLIIRHYFPNQFASICPPDEEVEALIDHPKIHGVTLTGSTRAGRRVAIRAAQNLKKCVLELGGSDAFLIGAQASLPEVVKRVIEGRLVNRGQSCIAVKRVLVPEAQSHSFLQLLQQELAHVDVGPLAYPEVSERLQQQVNGAMMEGAQVLWPKQKNIWPAIVLAQGTERFFREEEFFGPVFVLCAYRDLDHAIELANRCQFGLGGSVWGCSEAEQQKLARELEVGFLCFDDLVRSRPDVPFGGQKMSGLGWEMGMLGFFEFTQIRMIKLSH